MNIDSTQEPRSSQEALKTDPMDCRRNVSNGDQRQPRDILLVSRVSSFTRAAQETSNAPHKSRQVSTQQPNRHCRQLMA